MRATTGTSQRGSPLGTFINGSLHTGGYDPNQYDACLDGEHQYWQQILNQGGLERLCCPEGRKPYVDRPWIKMPSEGRAFSPVGIVSVSAFTPGTPTTVLSFVVPFGYDGIVNYVVMELAPPSGGSTGFSEGDGDVSWSVTANQRHLRDLGGVLVSRGSLIDPSPIPNAGLRVYSYNEVQFNVTLAIGNTLNSQANVICALWGWFYPR